MERFEAMVLLKELVAIDLVEPSFVHIMERMPNRYQLQIRSQYNREQLDDFAKQNSLAIEEDKEKKYLLIFKP